MQRVALLLGAFMLWLLAIVGAIAVAVWLRLSLQDTRLLVMAVAFVAFFGAFLPVLRMTQNRKP
jgi:predicted membrane-bound spermidine synthase